MQLTTLLLTAMFSAGIASAQHKSTPLTGAWRVTKVQATAPNAVTTSNPQPSLYLFTGQYYSIMQITSGQPRPNLPQDTSKATAAELLAVWGPFTANSGTYEIKGQTVSFHPLVAKNPAVMANQSPRSQSFKIEGKTLTMTGGTGNSVTLTLEKLE